MRGIIAAAVIACGCASGAHAEMSGKEITERIERAEARLEALRLAEHEEATQAHLALMVENERMASRATSPCLRLRLASRGLTASVHGVWEFHGREEQFENRDGRETDWSNVVEAYNAAWQRWGTAWMGAAMVHPDAEQEAERLLGTLMATSEAAGQNALIFKRWDEVDLHRIGSERLANVCDRHYEGE